MPDEMDINAIADSIGKDIFGSSDESGAGDSAPAATPPADPASPAAAASLAPPSDPDPWAPLPKAWKKEKEPLWAKLDREAREYIHARENDVVKGFEQYSTGHKSWNELISPFQPVIQQNPDVNPVQLMQNLMRNHLAIIQGSPEQKKQLAQALLKSYGIDLGGQNQPQAALPQEVQFALQEARAAKEAAARLEKRHADAELEQNRQKVEKFMADPANKYFEEVADDIMLLLKTGAAPTLEAAYEKAIWTNPSVRAKVIAEQATAPKDPPKKPLNVDGSGGTPPKKPKTFEETTDSIMEKHYGPNWRSLQ